MQLHNNNNNKKLHFFCFIVNSNFVHSMCQEINKTHATTEHAHVATEHAHVATKHTCISTYRRCDRFTNLIVVNFIG